MFRRQHEIPVRSNEGEVVPDAKLRNQCVNSAQLYSRAPAVIAKLGSINVIPSIRDQQWQGGKLLEKLPACLWACKTLQQFLKYESRGDDGFASIECSTQGLNFWSGEIGIAAKRQRPDAGVDQQGHFRERSDL